MPPDTEHEQEDTTLEDFRRGQRFQPLDDDGNPSDDTYYILSATSHVTACQITHTLETRLPMQRQGTTRKFQLAQRVKKA